MGVDVQLLPATAAHLEALAADVRPDEAARLGRLGFESAAELLGSAMASSDVALCALFDGRPAAVCGMGPFGSPGLSFVWAFCGRLVDRHPRTFWALCRPVLQQLADAGGVLVAFVDAQHVASQRWLRRLGFRLHPAAPWGVAGAPHCKAVWEG